MQQILTRYNASLSSISHPVTFVVDQLVLQKSIYQLMQY